jgi:hypothetical protein
MSNSHFRGKIPETFSSFFDNAHEARKGPSVTSLDAFE